MRKHNIGLHATLKPNKTLNGVLVHPKDKQECAYSVKTVIRRTYVKLEGSLASVYGNRGQKWNLKPNWLSQELNVGLHPA